MSAIGMRIVDAPMTAAAMASEQSWSSSWLLVRSWLKPY